MEPWPVCQARHGAAGLLEDRLDHELGVDALTGSAEAGAGQMGGLFRRPALDPAAWCPR